MRSHLLLTVPFILGMLAAAGGCSTALPPQELTNARTAYERASHGPAAELTPADLHSAKTSLDAAEQSFEKNGVSPETIDAAYIATRRAELAESRARTVQATRAKDQTNTNMQLAAASKAQTTAADLGHANQEIAMQGQALVNERQRREEAEKSLAEFATVKHEARGTVITLSGSVVFASGKAELLPAAQTKLKEVAEVLIKGDTSKNVVVEGHSDSQGAQAFNQDLSQRRAQSVRDYLVSRGLAADRVTAQGFGSSRSIADNSSPEGRANNRRVEIVVKSKE